MRASRVPVELTPARTDSEEARAFLQARLALWSTWVFTLSTAFFLVNVLFWFLLARALGPGSPLVLSFANPGNLIHLATSLFFGAVALATRTGRPSLPWLRAIDVGAMTVGCAGYALMGLFLARAFRTFGQDSDVAIYSGLLAYVSVITSRAIIVPSATVRTLVLGVIAGLPLVPATALAVSATPAAVVPTLMNVATWAATSTAIATVGSSVIYGLRKEAAQVRRLGQYTLEEEIGAGGMGVVYRASHVMLRRPTAIKLLPPDRAGEANLLRFEREVQLTAQLSHPNTIAIYDYGRTPDGVFYYAMEFLDGVNLEELVDYGGPVAPARVIHVLDQVCGALTEAHDHGLIHRDIKPANIILTERGGEPDVAKVVDFGLVKQLEPEASDLTLSSTTMLTGTPLYLPPEAITDPDLRDARTDLYAVGAVGYFLLTGRPVFEASTVVEVFAHHLHSVPVPPSQRTTQPVPADLEAVILQCLRKPLEDRPPDARTLRGALAACRDAGLWSAEQALAWWRAYRAARPAARRRTQPRSDEATIKVDMTSRVKDAVLSRR